MAGKGSRLKAVSETKRTDPGVRGVRCWEIGIPSTNPREIQRNDCGSQHREIRPQVAKDHADLELAAFTFAHLAFYAALIAALPAALILRFFLGAGAETVAAAGVAPPFDFAHREPDVSCVTRSERSNMFEPPTSP